MAKGLRTTFALNEVVRKVPLSMRKRRVSLGEDDRSDSSLALLGSRENFLQELEEWEEVLDYPRRHETPLITWRIPRVV